MKTTPHRWYRDALPQVEGWRQHCLLAEREPEMAAVVDPFRDIIVSDPPAPLPYAELRPLGFDDFLRGYVYMTTGVPVSDEEPIEMRMRIPWYATQVRWVT